MDSFVAVVAIVLNLALWGVFFAKLSQRFNIRRFTDETRTELEKTIIELNGIVARNISLIDDKIAELNKVSSERIAEMKNLSESIDRKILLQKQEAERAVQVKATERKVSTTMEAYRAMGRQFQQAKTSAEQEISVRQVPLYEPPVAIEKKVPLQDFAAQVKELYLSGISPDAIASKLSRTVTEVQFVLDMNNF